jgi:hypothetical protein
VLNIIHADLPRSRFGGMRDEGATPHIPKYLQADILKLYRSPPMLIANSFRFAILQHEIAIVIPTLSASSVTDIFLFANMPSMLMMIAMFV